ncbi:hypothetical protein Ddc_21548 [Ditylenchus destructor]|nr:hypothetical protein Ddc_21548 [Ditylenchus destructor]
MNFLGSRTLTVCARQLLCPRAQRSIGAFAFGTLSEKKGPPKKEKPGRNAKNPRMPAEKLYQSPDPNLVASVRKQILMNASEESRTLVLDIVKLYEERGKTFILPLADKKAMNLIACSFHNLLQIGLKRDFLIDACLKWEGLFCAMTKQGTEFMKILPIIAETTKWTFEDTMAFMAE